MTQTQTLGGPGSTAAFHFNNDTFKFSPLNNAGGEQLTVTAVPIAQSSLNIAAPFTSEKCIPYKDYSDAAGVDTCVLFHVVCSGADCSTIRYQLLTSYFLPGDLPGINGPDFLKASNQPCPPPGKFFDQSIFLEYNPTGTDPTTKGGSGTPSCFVATYTSPGPATTSTVSVNSYFAGFFAPVDNIPTLNTAKVGATIPIKFQVFDATTNSPITAGLTYCNPLTTPCGPNTVAIRFVTAPSAECSSTTGADAVPLASGQSGLQFTGGVWQYNAQTKGLIKGCYRLEVSFPTGDPNQPAPVHTALFSFK